MEEFKRFHGKLLEKSKGSAPKSAAPEAQP
jgi:hypothetical protein